MKGTVRIHVLIVLIMQKYAYEFKFKSDLPQGQIPLNHAHVQTALTFLISNSVVTHKSRAYVPCLVSLLDSYVADSTVLE